MTSNIGSDLLLENKGEKEVLTLLKQYFKPEFLNRIDEIITFKPLDKNVQLQIVNKMLKDLDIRLLEQNINIEFTNNLKEWILQQSFYITYGARPIKRFITKYIETFIATKIIKGEILPNVSYVLDINRDELTLFNK